MPAAECPPCATPGWPPHGPLQPPGPAALPEADTSSLTQPQPVLLLLGAARWVSGSGTRGSQGLGAGFGVTLTFSLQVSPAERQRLALARRLLPLLLPLCLGRLQSRGPPCLPAAPRCPRSGTCPASTGSLRISSPYAISLSSRRLSAAFPARSAASSASANPSAAAILPRRPASARRLARSARPSRRTARRLGGWLSVGAESASYWVSGGEGDPGIEAAAGGRLRARTRLGRVTEAAANEKPRPRPAG